MRITWYNYRAVSEAQPVTLELLGPTIALVGPNNIGKSSLIKFFHEFSNFFEMAKNPFHGDFWGSVRGRTIGFTLKDVLDPDEVINNKSDRPIRIAFEFEKPNPPSQVPHLESCVISRSRGETQWAVQFAADRVLFKFDDPNAVNFSAEGFLLVNGDPVCDFRQFFFEMSDISQALYIGSFRSAVSASNGAYYGLQIGEAFIDSWSDWKSGPKKDRNELIQGVIRDIESIFGYSHIDVTATHDRKSLLISVDGKSFKLHELGSGLAQTIFILGTCAIRQPKFLFIDEPELSLHPSLQLKLFDALARYVKGPIVFATHSYGLARTVADRTIVVQRNNGNIVLKDAREVVNLSQFMGEMGFSAYRDGGYERLIFVEGRTDVKVFATLMRKLDRHVGLVIAPLGGGDMINKASEYELSEVRKLCDKISVVIDSEKDSDEAKVDLSRANFVERCSKLGMRVHVLGVRATENIFSDSHVKAAFGKSKTGLGAFEKLAGPHSWKKNESWRIAELMTKDEIVSTDLGKFLAEA